jgi:hypothetical protein
MGDAAVRSLSEPTGPARGQTPDSGPRHGGNLPPIGIPMAAVDLRLGLVPCPACAREACAVIRDVAGVRTLRVDPVTWMIHVEGDVVRSDVEAALRAAGYHPEAAGVEVRRRPSTP